MAIVCIGDVHKRAGDRRDAARRLALDQILAHARAMHGRHELDAVIWLGDLYDRESGIDDRNTLKTYLLAFGALAPQVIVQGNHDKPGDLDILADLSAAATIRVVTEPTMLYMPAAAIACLPYPAKGGLVAAGVTADGMRDAVALGFDAVFARLGAELAASTLPPLFVGHITVGGAETSVGQPMIGHDVQIDGSHLAKLPPDAAKVLGHIHKPQVIHGAYYVGSIAPCDFGEAERKRFLVLEHTAGVWQVESVPLNVAPLYHVEGVFDGTAVSWLVKRGPEGAVETTPATFAGCEVRARVRFSAGDAGRLAVARAQLLADFADAAHLEIEPVAIPEQSVRAPEIARATTTVEKLGEWCRLAGVATSEGVLAKLSRLEAPDRAVILVELEARLRGSAVAA